LGSICQEVNHFCPGVPVILVGMKSDTERNNKHITVGMAAEMANKMRIDKYLQCSARKNEKVTEIFEEAVRSARKYASDRQRKKSALCIVS
jgi:GTPase SAR1 family protein